MQVRLLAEEEKLTKKPEVHKKNYRMQLRLQIFSERRLHRGLPCLSSRLVGVVSPRTLGGVSGEDGGGCQEGQLRVARRVEKENEKLARKVEESDNCAAKRGRRARVRMERG